MCDFCNTLSPCFPDQTHFKQSISWINPRNCALGKKIVQDG
mgnify:CR=1 FL=1